MSSVENVLSDALARIAAADGQHPVTLTAEESIALLTRVADLDLADARYRWIRTHQYLGYINAGEPCDPNSPAAIQFDRRIDLLRKECP